MIDSRRLEAALAFGLIPMVVLLLIFAVTPQGAFTLAGNTGSPGARVYGSSMVIDGMGLYGSSVDGRSVTHYDIGELERIQNMVIERDFNPGGLVPGGGSWTAQVSAPYAVAPVGIDIYASNSCVSGVGVTNFGLFAGLVDPFINAAVAHGHHPNLITFLVNIIGPSGFINFTVNEFWAEAMVMRSGRLDASRGLSLSIVPQRVSPAFHRGCL